MSNIGAWGWDETNSVWVKIAVDADGHIRMSDADPMEMIQDTPEDLKHTPHGYDDGGDQYLPYAVDGDGKLEVVLSALATLSSITDVVIAGIADGMCLYWDNATATWKVKQFLPLAGGTMAGAIDMDSQEIQNLPAADENGEPIRYDEYTAHEADADAHHSEEIAQGRGKYNTTQLLSLPGSGATDGIAMAYTASRLYYFPLHITTPITVDQVTINPTIAAGAGEKCRVGIYAADTDWQPGALLVQSAEIAIDSTGVVDTAIASTVLQEGRYLIGFITEGNATFRAVYYGYQLLGYSITLPTHPSPSTILVPQVYGALPNPGTFWTTVAVSAGGMRYPVYLRVSSP